MKKSQKILVYFPSDRDQSLAFSLFPLLRNSFRNEFILTNSLAEVRSARGYGALLLTGVLKRWSDGSENLVKLLTELRSRYDVLAYFDDNDSTECHHLGLIKYFDHYFKRQVFKDRTLYGKTWYGNRIFSDYYHMQFGISENPAPENLEVTDSTQWNKIKPLWNILVGSYPLSGLKQKSALALFSLGRGSFSKLLLPPPKFIRRPSPEKKVCHARFSSSRYRPTVGYQRKLFLEKVQESSLFLSGRVPKKQYDQELTQVRAVLSPFGWGEVCFRDAEAIFHGSVLLKPDMGHVETWPSVYQNGQTYISLKWDGSDVLEKTESILSNVSKREEVVNQAWQVLKQAYDELPLKVVELRDLLLGK